MFIKTLARKVSAFLRNRPISEENRIVPFDPDAFIEELNADPWYTQAYWAIYRFFKWHKIFHPTEIYYEIKYFIQRGRRGWADCDTWSLDDYLDGFMPDALRYLKEHKHGVPMSMFDGLPVNEHGYHDDEYFKIAEERWNAVMDKMIAAFEASRRMQDGLYEKELGAYPLSRPAGVSRDAWAKVKDDRFAASRLLEARDQEIFKEGMALFVEHYRSLWD